MSTRVMWKGDMSFEAETESNHKVLLDLAEKSGGHDKAARPGELVLVSLAGCTAVDVVNILKKMREQLDHLEVIVNSEEVDKHPKVYKKIEMEYNFKGKNLKEENVQKAIQLSLDKYCSVKTMLEKTAEITYRYEITNI
jgi:putative redox protein